MSEWAAHALILALAFVLGSVPFGLIIARVFKVGDLREKGSGNIGATNVSRVAGFWPAGFLTFLLDTLKGSAAVLLAMPISQPLWAPAFELSDDQWTLGLRWSAGLFAVLGHCFTPWLVFRGGKGVATAFGVIAVLSPWAALAGIVGFALTFLITRVGALGSLAGLGCAALAYLVLSPVVGNLGPHLWAGALMIFVILVRHESNLDAILRGDERKF